MDTSLPTSKGNEPLYTHFRVPARELRFDQPEPCPHLAGLTLDAFAATPDGQHHLVVTLTRANGPTVRAYLGPDERMIARRGMLLVAGLKNSGVIDIATGGCILAWFADAWLAFGESLSEESPRGLTGRSAPSPAEEVGLETGGEAPCTTVHDPSRAQCSGWV